MTVSMTELMRAVRNFFVSGTVPGPWTVTAGALSGPETLPPGWVGLPGGAYALDADGLVPDAPDMAFDGPVYLLAPPPDFVRLLGEINDWLEAQGASAGAGVTRRRESFGAYTTEIAYSVAAGSSGSWESAFAGKLAPWRRMFSEVNL